MRIFAYVGRLFPVRDLYVCLPLVCIILCMWLIPGASAIGCFVCNSVNGSEPECEDTFNNTGRFYREECFAGRKGRSGLFPGTECIKMKAHHELNYEILVRLCVVDNGDINSQTEIGRVDHCGFVNWVEYDGESMSGCILTCSTDGCNTAVSAHKVAPLSLVITSLILPLLWATSLAR